MADLYVDYTVGEVGLVAATVKTLLQLKNAAHHRFKLIGFQITFSGVSGTAEPVLVELCQVQATGGDGTSSALTGRKRDPSLPETVQTTALQTFTAEPTTSNVLRRWLVHPQGGYEYIASFGQEYCFGGATAAPDSGRCSIRATAPANVDCAVTMSIEE